MNKYYKKALGVHKQWAMLPEMNQMYTDLDPLYVQGTTFATTITQVNRPQPRGGCEEHFS